MMEDYGSRRAKLGIYSDRVVLSVEEHTEEAGNYCLCRKEWEEDFLDAQGCVLRESLLKALERLVVRAKQLDCSQMVCLGCGLLRYDDSGLQQFLGERLGIPVCAVSGSEQSRAACMGMQQSVPGSCGCEAGMHSSDMSTQIFSMNRESGWQESFPLGWRFLWQQYGSLVPDRVKEEQMRQEIKMMLEMTSLPRERGGGKLCAAGLDAAARFLWLTAGSTERPGEGISIEREIFGQLFRALRNPSLRWLGTLEQAGGLFPQKVFCQLLILETVMEHLGVREAFLGRVCLEDYLQDSQALCSN